MDWSRIGLDLESYGLIGALLALIVYMVKYHKADKRAESAEVSINAMKAKYEYEEKQKLEAKDETRKLKKVLEESAQKKRDDLAYRNIDLTLQQGTSWIDRDKD